MKKSEMKKERLQIFEDYIHSGKHEYGINHNTPDCFGSKSEQLPECKICPFRQGCSDTINM